MNRYRNIQNSHRPEENNCNAQQYLARGEIHTILFRRELMRAEIETLRFATKTTKLSCEKRKYNKTVNNIHRMGKIPI